MLPRKVQPPVSIRDNRLVVPISGGEAGEAISPAQATAPVRIRYLRARDEGAHDRAAFVRDVFGDPACFPFADEGTFALSRAEEDYEILILDVADPSRMARFLRVNRALLRNVATFAMMRDSSPPRRARMLMAGCDDVFDCARTSPEEAMLRVDAVLRWYRERRANWLEVRRAAVDLAHLAAPNRLTPRECALLRALMVQPGTAMSAQRLCRYVAPPDPAQFKRSLRFAISRLRSKLHPQWRIECAGENGYALLPGLPLDRQQT